MLHTSNTSFLYLGIVSSYKTKNPVWPGNIEKSTQHQLATEYGPPVQSSTVGKTTPGTFPTQMIH